MQSRIKNVYNAGWSSLVARRAHNPKVIGSNPVPATKYSQVRGTFQPSGLFAFLSDFGDLGNCWAISN